MLLDLINFEKIKRAVLYCVCVFVALLFQNLVFSNITVLGVRAMFMPAVAVAVGMFEGGVWGAMFGLLAGVFCDMTLGTTVLFTALLPVIGFFSGVLSEWFVNKRFFAYMCVCAVALAVTALIQMFRLWAFLGQDGLVMLRVAALQALWSLLPAAIVYFPCRGISGERKINGQTR